MIVNINDLKPILAGVLAPLDGGCLNELPAFGSQPPTAENLVNFLWSQLPPTVADGVLTQLRLQETRDFQVEKFSDTMRVTKKYEFAAAHRLKLKGFRVSVRTPAPVGDWLDELNRRAPTSLKV